MTSVEAVAADLLTVREWDRAIVLAQRDRRRAVMRMRARHCRHDVLLLVEARKAGRDAA